jgi:hypothetical protein
MLVVAAFNTTVRVSQVKCMRLSDGDGFSDLTPVMEVQPQLSVPGL